MHAPSEPAPAAPADAPYRLPRTVEPTAYRLTLAPDLDRATFAGTVEIDVVVRDQTDTIVLNAAELEITGATVSPPAGDAVTAVVTLDEAAERATLRLEAPLAKGDATVTIGFNGILNDKLRGFYRSTYTDDEGTTHTIATSQMESTDARRAFPCWDEPDRKATFEITLVVAEGLSAYSNSPIASERPVTGPDGSSRREVRFRPTIKMSTYLVAFVVGPLVATEPVEVGGVPVRVVHAPGKAHLTGFALDVARHALEFFTAYFAIDYPGEKLDLVAIPDFAFGAMENLGCVTFRETVLLADEHSASRLELERIADVVHHEIAHMWFGDLVTMGWWEGIWLNEAFATFMEILATDDYRPQWQRWVSFGLDRERALAIDALHATRPIEYPVGSPEEATGMFDVLTYEKGGSVLRMLEQYLGPDTFRDGVRRYLEAHAYGNTVTADLWNALEEASGEPVRAVADSWILQGGHPLVTVGDALTQTPFTYLPEPPGEESSVGEHWLVPVLVRTLREGETGGAVHRLLLAEEPVPLPAVLAEVGVGVVNAGGWGVYRVGYSASHREALAARLATLAPLERFNLFADAWALVQAGRQDLGDLLAMASRLGDEEEPGIYAVVAGALSFCDRVCGEADRPLVQAAARRLLGTRAATLGWDARPEEGERIPTLRALLVGTLGIVGHDDAVRAEAVRRFDAAMAGGPPLDPDLAAAVLGVVADQRRDGDYETLLDRYRHPATPQEELRYLMALGAFPDEALTLRTFEMARTDDVRTQNAPYLVAALLGNKEGGAAVWREVEAHWDELLARYPENSHSRMVAGVRNLYADAQVAAEVTAFLTAHPLRAGQRTVVQTLEQLQVATRLAGRLGEGGALSVALEQAAES